MTGHWQIAVAWMLGVALVAAAQDKPSGPATRPAALPPDQMLDRMLRSGSEGQTLQPVHDQPRTDRTTGTAAVAPGAPQMSVMREGSYIVDRLGRLTPSADGQQMEFTFESDGKTLQDPPLVLLPNLKLMAMERAVELANRDLRFRITGMVTEYKGRNYILLDKVVVVPEE
jgi:hypothetical protein